MIRSPRRVIFIEALIGLTAVGAFAMMCANFLA